MKRLIKYPSIEQFRNIHKKVTQWASYVGKDENGDSIFDYLKPKPVLTFTATEKIHGTNAGVCYSIPDGIWAQSKENIITPEKDNAGFAFFSERNKDVFIDIIKKLAQENDIDLTKNIISLYGEWAGGSIQKNSALSNNEKVFIIFQYFKVSPLEQSETEHSRWYETVVYSDFGVPQAYIEWAQSPENKIYNIMNFPKWIIEVDFNKPEISQNDMINLVQETIEPSSPLGKEFGHLENVGEGIVCSHLCEDGGLIQFKVKGEKHSNSKVKTLKAVDMEKLSKVEECVEKICHNWRFEQAITEIFGSDYENNLDRKKIGLYLKWITTDTLKEESDIIADYGFEPRDVLPKVTEKAKKYFMELEKF